MTVGIPFYNAQQTLADAIRSVFAQTLTDWELILVDDGSTDASLAVARSIADPRVRVVSDGRNLRLAARLNQIAQLARGRYLARMDADDMMHRDRFALQAEFLDRNPAVDVVGTGLYILDADSRPTAKRLATTEPLSARQILAGGGLMHATVMGRTDWFRRNHYDSAQPPAYPRAEDRELWYRTLGRLRFANLPGCCYYYAKHSSFSLRNSITALWSGTRATWTHGVRHVGHLACCAICVKKLVKIPVYTAAVGLRVHGRLIARRSIKLSPSEIEQVAADVARIRATPLPTCFDATAARLTSTGTSGCKADVSQ